MAISSVEIEYDIVGVWLTTIVIIVRIDYSCFVFEFQGIESIGKGYPFESNISTAFLQT